MRRLSVIFATLASILLILILIFSMLQVTINSETFINNEFTKLGTAKTMGMNNADLVASTMRLIDYMEGRVPSINIDVTIDGQKTPMFALEQEHSHMADVRTLYQAFRSGRDLGILVMLILFLIAVLMGFRRAANTLATGYLSGLFACALVFGFVGVWALLDFSGFWTAFHQMLFWNEDWLFDATTSRMINMLPEQLFADIIGRMAVYALAAIGLLTVLAIVSLIRAAVRRRRARERAEAKRLALIEQKRKAAAGAAAPAEAQAPAEPAAYAEPAAPGKAAAPTEPAAPAGAAEPVPVGDEIPRKPKDKAAKARSTKTRKKKEAPAAKERRKAEAAPARAEKRVKQERRKKLRRGDAPFELNLDAAPDGDDDGTI